MSNSQKYTHGVNIYITTTTTMAKKGAERNSLATVDQSSSFNISKLLILGLLFHVIFIGSVFDCYFTSPVVNGMKSFNVGSAHAKRLVLIVGACNLHS
jgi:phosphatidylinositol glycan class N